MIFGPSMLEQILAGTKTVTRRQSDRYRAGRSYAVQPGRTRPHVARILVEDVRQVRVGAITDAEARLEGFDDRAGFLAYWGRLYGQDADLDLLVCRIQFRLLEETVRADRVAALRERWRG